jgi:hypothetical protein
MRIAILYLFLLSCSFTLQAKPDVFGIVKLDSGLVTPIFQKGEISDVCFNYERAKSNGMPVLEYLATKGEKEVADWPGLLDESIPFFIDSWNERNKKGLQIIRTSEAKYRLEVVVDDVYINRSSGAELSGTVYLVEKESGRRIGKFKVLGLKSIESFSFTEARRLKDTYEVLAKLLLGEARKNKKHV